MHHLIARISDFSMETLEAGKRKSHNFLRQGFFSHHPLLVKMVWPSTSSQGNEFPVIVIIVIELR